MQSILLNVSTDKIDYQFLRTLHHLSIQRNMLVIGETLQQVLSITWLYITDRYHRLLSGFRHLKCKLQNKITGGNPC